MKTLFNKRISAEAAIQKPYQGATKKFAMSSLVIATVMLSACGGSSSDSSSDGQTTPDNALPINTCDTSSGLTIVDTTSDLNFNIEQSYSAGQSATVIANINNRDSAGLTYQWQQTSGPDVSLSSENSPVLSFIIPSSGNYSFTANVSGPQIDLSETVSITAGSAINQLNINSDHQVVQGNGVSLRVARINEQIVDEIEWCYFSNQAVELDLTDPERPLFTAPSVSSDSVIGLKATGQFAGETLSDEVFVLVTNESAITSPYFDQPVARTYSYNSASIYSANASDCVYSNQLNQTCDIADLPLIGQVSNSENIESVMERVVVSHDWMGENFETFLKQSDPNSDFIKLLQSVTAVVISYDVRPSFYWVATGAIYLDPEYLWFTPEQRDSINEAPDYRSDFGNDLQFIMPWRYVKDNDYAYGRIAKTERTTRTLADITPSLASLLYHELAHANDFFPRSIHSTLTGPTLIDDFYRRTDSNGLISDQLQNVDPLTSSEMFGLAGVSFLGETANETQKAYMPDDVTSFFLSDHANDFYAYSSTREDAAMLFEESFMSHRYQIQRDVAVTDPTNLIVDWGQRGRVGSAELLDRAAFAIDEIMPEIDGKTLLNGLPEPINMTPGRDWFENIDISPSIAQSLSKVSSLSSSETSVERRPVLIGREHRDMPIPKR
ncbi:MULTISPECIES: hypothetical protein [unclassified Shewanella]|uniref:PKD domain-containing protein n=2 Tax=Shewanella TaxID=22 RepID=UPI0026E18C9A|nr:MULTISPECIES: hypothetical protein [unclassified Shewanella]MDO6610981.1 hypothetical protein [Shewanella sp. 7_MG-2023]MDO6770168.1 hypothetical protein [Shewanella sp. 2_MG-2023]